MLLLLVRKTLDGRPIKGLGSSRGCRGGRAGFGIDARFLRCRGRAAAGFRGTLLGGLRRDDC